MIKRWWCVDSPVTIFPQHQFSIYKSVLSTNWTDLNKYAVVTRYNVFNCNLSLLNNSYSYCQLKSVPLNCYWINIFNIFAYFDTSIKIKYLIAIYLDQFFFHIIQIWIRKIISILPSVCFWLYTSFQLSTNITLNNLLSSTSDMLSLPICEWASLTWMSKFFHLLKIYLINMSKIGDLLKMFLINMSKIGDLHHLSAKFP